MTSETLPGRRRAVIALVLPLLAIPASNARAQEPAPALTLQAALRRALEANPATAAARSQAGAATAQVRQLRSAILPKVELNGAATRNSSEVAFDINGFSATILPENDWRYDLTLRQPVFAGRRELRAIRQGRLNLGAFEQGVRRSEEAALLVAAADFLAVVQGDALLGVERGNLELAERRRRQSQAFYEAGEVTRVDVLRAETDIKAVERALAVAEQGRETAASRLRQTLALDEPPGTPLRVEAPRLELPPLPAVEELIRQAQTRRPEVRQAEIALEIARLEVAKQWGARLPLVTSEASWISQRANFPADQYGSFTLRLSLPLFDSGEISAKVAVAREAQRQAEIAFAERQRAVREDVLQALLDLRTAEKSLGLAREQLAAAEAEYSQSFELYRAQEATSLDLQAAESALAESRRAVVTEGLNRDLAELAVWSAVGTLKETVLAEEVKP